MTGPLWWEGAAPPAPPPSLPGSVDVAIVGGGLTGLWSAYYLLRTRPDLGVLVLEAEHVGFGASGRNGGWVSALFPVSADALAARHGRPAAERMLDALVRTVDEVGSVAQDEGVDAGFIKGGTLVLARGEAQAARAMDEVIADDAWGVGTTWLGREETLERFAVADAPGRPVLGATVNPHCARVQPRRLVDGLAAAVRRRGGVVAEGCPVADVRATTGGSEVVLRGGEVVRAATVVRATEAWTATLPRLRRRLAPVYSLMVATAPLTAEQWSRVGLEGREVFADHGRSIIYGQRTVDDRIAFGGRGAPYHLGSRVAPRFDRDERVFAALRSELRSLLPDPDLRFTHAWGGPLAVPRDWHPAVGYDRAAGVAWAGGYVGDGVAATNLAGRTIADLVTGVESELTTLPWVEHRSPRWEPEPLRWLGINAGLRGAALADAQETRTGRPAAVGRIVDRLTGH